jgi:hypothetical protein
MLFNVFAKQFQSVQIMPLVSWSILKAQRSPCFQNRINFTNFSLSILKSMPSKVLQCSFHPGKSESLVNCQNNWEMLARKWDLPLATMLHRLSDSPFSVETCAVKLWIMVVILDPWFASIEVRSRPPSSKEFWTTRKIQEIGLCVEWLCRFVSRATGDELQGQYELLTMKIVVKTNWSGDRWMEVAVMCRWLVWRKTDGSIYCWYKCADLIHLLTPPSSSDCSGITSCPRLLSIHIYKLQHQDKV